MMRPATGRLSSERCVVVLKRSMKIFKRASMIFLSVFLTACAGNSAKIRETVAGRAETEPGMYYGSFGPYSGLYELGGGGFWQ